MPRQKFYLRVEVLSPNDDPANVRLKLMNYLNAGTTVWIVDSDNTTVEIYVRNQSPVKLAKTDTLSGGSVLPGFTMPVKDIFD